jgi:hypothetical protein
VSDLQEVLDFLPAVKFAGNCCILASLAIRDVLRRLGHPAEVRSVALNIKAHLDGLPLHEVGVGMNALWGTPYEGKNWDGHLVTVVGDTLIDPTFYEARRESWSWVPDVAVVPKARRKPPLVNHGLPVLARLETAERGYEFRADWLAYSRNRGWEKSPDHLRPERRRIIVEQVLDEYRKYREAV